MDTWDKLIEQAKETERCAKIARENVEKHAAYWRLKNGQKEEQEQISDNRGSGSNHAEIRQTQGGR